MSLDAAEYTDLYADTTETFHDLCRIGSGAIIGGYDPSAKTWIYGAEIACGFNASKSREVNNGSQATLTDAELRVGLDNLISGTDRILLTGRHGETVTEYYEIVGAPRRGISCFVLNLKRIAGDGAAT